MKRSLIAALALAAALLAPPARAGEQGDAPPWRLTQLPVREVTVFKDGYALVTHQGTLPTDAAGDVTLDARAAPVLGTFWPFPTTAGVQLKSSGVERRRVTLERTALSLQEMIEANPGAEVNVTEKAVGDKPGPSYPATLAGIPRREARELEATTLPGAEPPLPQKSDLVQLKTAGGLKLLPLERIQDLTFINQPSARARGEELRSLLTLKLDWGGKPPAKEAGVGLAYVQRGIRWIPSYKVELDGEGTAKVRLQATLVNDLADLEDVTANLVVGVPTIAFRDMTDPLALQQAMAQLAPRFQANTMGQSYFSNGLSNAIMSQAPDPGLASAPAPAGAALGPEPPGSEKQEELFIFTVRNVTLKRGGALALPVAEFTFKYEDFYALEIPEAPPLDLMRNYDPGRQAEVRRLLAAPKVKHLIRLVNAAKSPLTTAPALLLRQGRVLAQALLAYTPAGGRAELELGTAVDIAVKFEDREVRRTPNAGSWAGEPVARIDLEGKIRLLSYKETPVALEVRRCVLGAADSADQQGAIAMLDVFGDPEGARPLGSGWNWPDWWSHFNGRGRITWTPTLEHGKPLELGYTWHYCWR